ncbi:hypothetical protein INT45_007541, partial [Circinella minor]
MSVAYETDVKRKLHRIAGIHVSVHPQKLWEAVAYGELAKQDRVLGDITVGKNQAIVTIEQVLKPAIILKAHKKSLREFAITAETNTTDSSAVLDDLINSNIDNNDTDSEDDDSIKDYEESTGNNSSNRPHSVSVTHEQINSSTTSQPSTTSSNPLPSRILKDAFYLIDMIQVPRKHRLAKEFTRRLRDAIFLIDKNDKRLIEEYLKTKHMTFDMMMDQNPTWVLRHVKRVIPPGKDLYPVVKKVFDTYGYLRCAKTGRPLFDDEAWRQSENVLNTIQLGHVSDPPGISFYFEIGKNKNNLPLYRYSHGTNSLEGEVHQNIICKFMSFRASPELADAVMADYRLRHNIDVGSFNRYGRVHKGHYEPWLTQHILDLRGSFENLAKELGIEVVSSDENIQANNVNFSTIINSTLETPALLTFTGSTLATKGARYRFIAQKQRTKFAILPNWSTYVNREDIFYKTPEHLYSYNGKYEELRTASLSMAMNSESRKEVHDIVSSEDRKRKVPSANKPSTNK